MSTAQVTDAEKAGGRAVGNTLKALAFMYVIITRDSIGAPVDVDLPITAAPAKGNSGISQTWSRKNGVGIVLLRSSAHLLPS